MEMQTTHEEVHKLIQFNVDHALKPREQETLSAHLAMCSACRTYAEEIAEVHKLLLPALNARWSRQPIPLSLEMLRAKKNVGFQPSAILTMRTTLIGLLFAAFAFSAWQFSLTGRETPPQSPVAVLPVPTPSAIRAQSTSTKLVSEGCEDLLYSVRENDTLASIATQFAISEEELMAFNNLQVKMVHAPMELKIPVCRLTPTNTFTTTYTPLLQLTTSTPGTRY